ncbi:hypothetical protein B6U66_01560 [Candidatus Bathyarchaeota archaeon ex4484_135]|nr:MAG: hypothetical protein B6U66_01560 [Candidatus Bathyarchaeota archaeon ex4484_135]
MTVKTELLGFEETLGEKVIKAGLCAGCGSCVLNCPFWVIGFRDGKPTLIDECPVCGVCAQVCPRYSFDVEAVEKFAFGRSRKADEEFGVVKRMVLARSKDPEVLEVCQDGGLVSSLLITAVEKGLVEGAVLSGVKEGVPCYPDMRVAYSKAEILACAGSRYTFSDRLVLGTGVAGAFWMARSSKYAFVGLPCQVQAVRLMQMLPNPPVNWSEAVRYVIGLFCTETFTYDGLRAYLASQGMELEDVRKMNIKAGKLVVEFGTGEVKELALEPLMEYRREGCEACWDFSAEFADISIGSLGLEGWNIALIRSERGEELFRAAVEAGMLETRPVEEEPNVLKVLRRLTRRKRRRAEARRS